MRRPSRSWRSLCRISKSTGIWSLNFRLDFKMNAVAPAPKSVWHDARPTVPSTRCALASDGTRLDTARWRWASLVPFPTSFASSPKRTYDGHPVRPRSVLMVQTRGTERPPFCPRAPQRNRNELGETTVNKTWRKRLLRPVYRQDSQIGRKLIQG